jgi:tetratricopeptide (TPR) repeat protein
MVQASAPVFEKVIADLNLPRVNDILELMREGLSLGDVLGIKKEHRDALLTQALGLIKVGEIDKARDALVMLYQLEPMDERSSYALASTYQLQGDFETAGKLYVLFIALDATNPEGHLRLAECFLGAKEFKNAIDTFEMARDLAKDAGDTANVEYADKMISITRDRQQNEGS